FGFSEDRPKLYKASRGACEVCCQKRAPSKEEINSVIASLLFQLASEIKEAGGMPGCDEEKAEELLGWAVQNLERIEPAANNPSPLPPTGPCFYLGEATGFKECENCQGHVRLKTFACHHEDHSETTRQDCQSCHDHEESIASQKVETWAVGVTTAPRKEPTLERSLRSLRAAGWTDPLVFSEPDVTLPPDFDRQKVVTRHRSYGAWPNWLVSAMELYLLHPKVDAYLICQDDVLYGKNLRAYLESTLWPGPRPGVVSLHTPSHRTRPDWTGFHSDNEGWRAWGAQAYVFPNASLRALLRHPTVINHRHRGPARGERNIDSVVGYWSRMTGLDYYIHQPSLTQHIGETSTLWPDATTAGKRQASHFVGEDLPVPEALQKKEQARP
ncbi:MAG: hypothetical protein AAF514_19615, partial [Verrucomicrobiota bacterium]